MSDDTRENYMPHLEDGPVSLACVNNDYQDNTNALGYNALHSAVYHDNIKMLESLLKEKDVDLNHQNHLGQTPLMLSILRRCSSTTIFALINAGCDINIADEFNSTPLHMAVLNNDITIAHELLKRGADVDVQDYCNKSNPLFQAVTSNNVEALCMLLYYGADVTVRNAENYTPFSYAIESFKAEMIPILLNYYDDFNDTDEDGYTLLHLIMEYGSDLAMRLVDEGADVNAITNDGCSVLEFSLDLGGPDLYKKIWSKLDLHSLLKIKVPLLLTYVKSGWSYSTLEWVECLLMMLESPIAADLMQHCSKYIFTMRPKNSFFAQLLNALYIKLVSPDDRLHIISICLSLGGEATTVDMDTAILLYGFNKELEALIYAAEGYRGTYKIFHPLLPYIVGWEYFKLENVVKFCKDQINTDSDILNPDLLENVIVNSMKFFSLPGYMKLELLHVCSTSPRRGRRIAEKVETAPEFPSLLELSRNQAHRFVKQISGSKKPYHFQDAVKNLRLPRSVVDVLRFKKPLYR